MPIFVSYFRIVAETLPKSENARGSPHPSAGIILSSLSLSAQPVADLTSIQRKLFYYFSASEQMCAISDVTLIDN